MKKDGMISVVRISISLLLCGVFVFFGGQAFGKKWTAIQKEVWDSQQAYFEHWRKGDFDGLLAMCHKDYTAWPYGLTGPIERRVHISNIVFYARISSFMLTPVEIKVFGNIANVYFIRRITLQEGKVYSDYAMTVWMNQDGKWLILGEMTASYKPMSIYLPRMQQDHS